MVNATSACLSQNKLPRGGGLTVPGSILFVLQVWTGGVVCGGGSHSSWPCPQGVGGGVGLVGGTVADVSCPCYGVVRERGVGI